MAKQPDVLDKLQSTLEPFIKPREQVNYIRRVLALHLGSCSHNGPIKQPVSLVDVADDVKLGPELKGVHREYIEALKSNVAARRKYTEVVQANPARPASPREPSSTSVDLVEEQIALLKLRNKLDRLSAVQKYLDLLIQKPAASVEFLDPEDIFHGAVELPGVPKEVVSSLVAQQSASKPDLKGQVAQLEKTMLRAKLMFRREEQLLRDARNNAQGIPDVISNGTRLDALNATRNELITWIETELGKASGEEDAGGGGDSVSRNQDRLAADSATVHSQLAAIKEKYARYLSARRSLLSAISERPGASQPPVLKSHDPTQHQTVEADPAPSNYLLTPYIETLLSFSRNQRAMITQKSYMNSTLSKETKDACQVLGHLAEESQLLPLYPMSVSSRRMSGLGEVLGSSSERSGFTGRIQPWVFAADSAKIATLETVAERVEGGQVALESSMKALREIDHLLGREQVDGPDEPKEEPTDDDFWLNTGTKKTTSTRKHTEKEKGAAKKASDAWSSLQGNLGLIGHGDGA
ncbi:hypothetical protein AK830_g7087 [Neonectria ditissima]|uniref:Uncharacterized protein n=1 Tax=Neonectria ditissima TaxID=78410 RepID=A0A0P7BFZ3_9HYPO|nr:hypothetical protein AK830_g7087 [Neonectria ditissima]